MPAKQITSIRPAKHEDMDALCSLYYEFHEFHARGVPQRLVSLGEESHQDWSRIKEALENIFQNAQAEVFVAEVDGGIAGLVEVYLRQDDETNALIVPYRYGHVQSLVVREAFRRRGVGGLLLDTAQRWATDNGANEMRLDVWEFAAGPLMFYEKAGFRTLKRALVKPVS